MKIKKRGEHEAKPTKTQISSKKIISVLLVMALLACSIPMTAVAGAAEFLESSVDEVSFAKKRNRHRIALLS